MMCLSMCIYLIGGLLNFGVYILMFFIIFEKDLAIVSLNFLSYLLSFL